MKVAYSYFDKNRMEALKTHLIRKLGFHFYGIKILDNSFVYRKKHREYRKAVRKYGSMIDPPGEDYKSDSIIYALEKPFKSLPLLVHCENKVIHEVVSWRLQVGK